MNPASISLASNFFKQLKESFLKNRLLCLALVLCFGFSLIGIHWGIIEDWNPDQMAFKGVPSNLMVGNYLKPPLTTYMARLLVLNPIDIVMKGMLHTSTKVRLEMRLIGVRLLTILYLCAAVTFVYFSIRRCNGKTAASVIVLIMGTSAGFIAYTHYGTADMPLVFWMTASFSCALYAALSGRLLFGIAAGLLAGLSAAAKYNGLGVAVAIPIFFLLHDGPNALLQKKLWLASLAVPVGFVLGCPGAIFDHNLFVQDFLYNLYTTPVYSGNSSHTGYGLFLHYIPSILGWPVSLLLACCVLTSILLFILRRLKQDEVYLLVGTLAVFFFYFLIIGRFPRVEMRFVMPAVPFLLVAAAPTISRINRQVLATALILLVSYNLVCCFFLGLRFLNDPRMKACSWAEKNFKAGDTVESAESPYWSDLIPGVKVINMPLFTGREASFKNTFGNNRVISNGVSKFDKDPSIEIFTREALQKRNPDYVTLSFFAVAFSADPLVQQYYKDHIAEKLGYHIVEQGKCWLPPQWAYPQSIDFLVPSMYILKKDELLSH